jgi:hypothetical protein
MIRLTPEIQEKMVAFLRAGGFPDVAAQAAGVPPDVFADWIRRGLRHKAKPRYRAFVRAIYQAIAQARLGAEVAIRGEKPLEWLKSGPGRSDWGRGRRESEQARPLMEASYQGLIEQMLSALEGFPEARQAAAEALVEEEKREKRKEERA